MNGWPEVKELVANEVRPHFNFRESITFSQGLLLKGEQLIVPSSMRKEMRALIHQGHLGIEKCKIGARKVFYWPQMTNEITDLVSSCDACMTYRNRQQRETLISHEIPSEPWIKVGTDCFHLKNNCYVIVVDYHSKFFELSKIPNLESSTVIKATKEIFSRHGIPKFVFSDNGPEFASLEYKEFATEWDFVHDSSSPYFPQSNGQVERTIQTVKRALKKAMYSNEDQYLALLALRTTPVKNSTV